MLRGRPLPLALARRLEAVKHGAGGIVEAARPPGWQVVRLLLLLLVGLLLLMVMLLLMLLLLVHLLLRHPRRLPDGA